jgi:uncharacterized protein YcfJ
MPCRGSAVATIAVTVTAAVAVAVAVNVHEVHDASSMYVAHCAVCSVSDGIHTLSQLCIHTIAVHSVTIENENMMLPLLRALTCYVYMTAKRVLPQTVDRGHRSHA